MRFTATCGAGCPPAATAREWPVKEDAGAVSAQAPLPWQVLLHTKQGSRLNIVENES